ncbi:MAG: 4-oxalocrotonate tautomerase [Betaproteobacteria bacterium]|nr:4-oxalocrotonate tautomerase [Betaproteobacteria bacterium]
MPFATIQLIEGRTPEQKRAVIEKVTQALVEAVGAPQQSIRVLIQEVPSAHWGIGGVPAQDLGR